jgi:hypothetical protein
MSVSFLYQFLVLTAGRGVGEFSEAVFSKTSQRVFQSPIFNKYDRDCTKTATPADKGLGRTVVALNEGKPDPYTKVQTSCILLRLLGEQRGNALNVVLNGDQATSVVKTFLFILWRKCWTYYKSSCDAPGF